MARKSGSHAEITGPRIRRAALSLFARYGYAAVSMRQIAAEVGVQAGALYLYVADKQALLFELMDAHMDSLMAAWEAVPKPNAPADRLRTFTDFHIAHHLERPDDLLLAYWELRSLTPDNHKAIAAKRRAYEAELEAILRAGHAEGVFRVPEARITAMAIIPMLNGCVGWYRSDGRLSVADVQVLYGRLVHGMVAPDPVPAPV
ncbi:MAG: TetR/AcrR family transcriptional regulator [Pseudomonadota bacterium]